MRNPKKEANFARIATVIGNFTLCCQAQDSSSCFFFQIEIYQDESATCRCKEFVFDWEMFPSLRSLPFSEFGRFGITDQIQPKLRKYICNIKVESTLKMNNKQNLTHIKGKSNNLKGQGHVM